MIRDDSRSHVTTIVPKKKPPPPRHDDDDGEKKGRALFFDPKARTTRRKRDHPPNVVVYVVVVQQRERWRTRRISTTRDDETKIERGKRKNHTRTNVLLLRQRTRSRVFLRDERALVLAVSVPLEHVREILDGFLRGLVEAQAAVRVGIDDGVGRRHDDDVNDDDDAKTSNNTSSSL